MADWTPKLDGLPDETLRCPDYLEAAENHMTEDGEHVSVYEAQVAANGNEGWNGEDGFPLCCACGYERSEHVQAPPPGPKPGTKAARAAGCACPAKQKPLRQVNYACDLHGAPAHRRDQRPCAHCGNRIGDPAWTHIHDLWGDMEVTKCHRVLERDEKTGRPVPKLPDERELGEAFRG